ncbi:MAG: hypothetical protein Kow0074_05400 [Candidatus Zixiibacteriota bacterium]
MRDIVEQLISVVAEEAEHCERILVLLRQQQDSLVRGDIDSLQNNLREQENSLRRSRELERRRRSLVQQVAEAVDLQEESPSLRALIATLSDDYGRRLSELRISMAAAIERVNKTKEQNRMLIERSLSNINEIIKLLAATNAAVTDYAGPSRKAPDAAALSVDRHC